ncbi:hypothetical protein VH570_01490 [Sphingobium sp. HT1-2]|uniref:hypothetical protein n=1 Tax=Sphingobium sp. HT1-2 TaxID=3111640 RepID=UPI003C035726
MVAKTTRYRREYNSWHGARYRCTSEKSPAWENYGGRGIQMCPQWIASFEQFLADMGERPEGKELDRINNDGNYEPGNCRWATPLENNNNKFRANPNIKAKKLFHNGVRATLDVWSAMLDIPLEELQRRQGMKLSVDCILGFRTKPGWLVIDGVLYELSDLSIQYDVSVTTIKSRVSEGATFDQAVGRERWVRSRVNAFEPISDLTLKGETKPVAMWSNLGYGSTAEIRERKRDGASDAQALGVAPYTPAQNMKFKAALAAIPGVVRL